MPNMPARATWHQAQVTEPIKFTCGYCGNLVASNSGWWSQDGRTGRLRICPECSGPTLFTSQGEQIPGVAYGKQVNHLPADIQTLYSEARSAIAASAPTAAVLCCRKILMHVAVGKGAKEGESFQTYVNHLADKNFVPAGARAWVDQIRTKSNEANHQIVIKSAEEAKELIDFVEMLLMVVYDYPSRAKSSTPPSV